MRKRLYKNIALNLSGGKKNNKEYKRLQIESGKCLCEITRAMIHRKCSSRIKKVETTEEALARGIKIKYVKTDRYIPSTRRVGKKVASRGRHYSKFENMEKLF
jgi:hypothetical protein